MAHCVKVDDAAPGISEGLHAGMWSVGLAVSGNEFGATWEEYQAMSKAEIDLGLLSPLVLSGILMLFTGLLVAAKVKVNSPA